MKETASLKNSNPSKGNKAVFEKAKADLTSTYETEQAKYLQTKIDLIVNSANNMQSAMAWKTINEISGRKGSSKAKLKAKDQSDRLKKWKEHFENLLGNIPKIDDQPIQQIIDHELNIKKGDFSMDELEKALLKVSYGKACGLDNIPAEVWKTGDFNQELLQFCNAVYNKQEIERWTEGCILPFPKKGDLGLTDNYRGITLTAIASKIYNLLLLNRIRPELEHKLRKNQNGFREKRSTVGQILTLRRIIEGVQAKNLDAAIVFIDFAKAFDSVHRGKLQQILLAYGIPSETVDAIMMLYKNTRSMVRSPDGDTAFFDILAGVLQGDTLAPYLFIICLDYVLRMSADEMNHLGLTLTKSTSRRHPAHKIVDIDYADDLAIMSDYIDNATKLLHSIEKAARGIGLYINAKKTEFMAYNQDGQIKSVAGNNIKQVDNFVYLGSSIQTTEKDIQIRKAKAWSALNKLDVIWKSNMPSKLKRDFFKATVETVLLYGSTTWTLTKKQESSLDGTYTRMLRAVLNVSWKDHPTKKFLYGHLKPISTTMREQRMRFSGHCWRNKVELASKLLLWDPKHGKRSVGRRRRTFIDQLADDAGCPVEDLPTAMSNREDWKERVRRVRANNSDR